MKNPQPRNAVHPHESHSGSGSRSSPYSNSKSKSKSKSKSGSGSGSDSYSDSYSGSRSRAPWERAGERAPSSISSTPPPAFVLCSNRRQPNPAFTLTELIAVITIIVVLLAVSIPAFRSTMASAGSSNAETQLRLAFLSAHAAALHSERGADTAVVFTYEPGGQTTALICEYAGTFSDRSGTPDSSGNYPQRDVFVPLPNFEPVQLAQAWMVRGLVPAGTFNLAAGSGGRDWYEDLSARSIDEDTRNWVLPETGFYDALATDDGANRQSFMVRFHGGIGSVALGDSREALVVYSRPTAAGRTEAPFSDYRVDIGADVAGTVRKAIARYADSQIFSSGGVGPLSQLFGDVSGDTILCRTVEQVVLYKSTDLANGIQAKLNRDTGTFYAKIDDRTKEPKYDIRPRIALGYITPWLEGNTNYKDNEVWLDEGDLPVARIYTVQRYTGALQPVPLLDLAGANR